MLDEIKKSLGIHKNFPRDGIDFVDISPVLRNKEHFRFILNYLFEMYKDKDIDKIVSVESRGFIFGSALAHLLGSGFVMVRKKGRLPGKIASCSYSKEYGMDCVEMQADSINLGENILIIDDLLATGGTIAACIELVKNMGGNIKDVCCLIELAYLNGRQNVEKHFDNITTVIKIEKG